MAVFLTGYGNKNYRSFGGDGVLLEGLKDINVIIGQNNGGKTNILRTLDIWESSRRGSPQTIKATDYYENDSNNNIEFEFIVPKDMLGQLEKLLVEQNQRPFIRFKLVGENQYDVIDSFVRKSNAETLRSYCNAYHSSSSSDINQNIQSVEGQPQFRELLNKVPPIQYLSERRVQAGPKNFRDRLTPIWNHGAGNRAMIPVKKALRDFLEEGVEAKIGIQFEQNSESFTIEMNDELIDFESLGSGFQQVFDVALTIASIKDSVVLIDEPELNMHPNLLRRLMKLIFANGSNQYIICTHSNILLDATYDKSIYQITGGKFSTVERCETLESTRELLNDLGVQASDILQTNGIIWVEGPSDRTYINHWLSLHGCKAQEGLDFTFQYYGGKLLAHYGIDDDVNDFVNILEVNRNAFIVIDSDWKNASRRWKKTDLAKRKQRIIEACKEKEIPYWVTLGREIENYISTKNWTEYEGKTIKLASTESIADKSSKYSIKAKAAHDIVVYVTKDDYLAEEELIKHISELDTSIKKWNNQ
jgi:nicotinic acid mononucleotide adenylyltransferase